MPARFAEFGRAIAASGEVAVVGAPGIGRAFVYRGLVEEAVLAPPAGRPGFLFGATVAVDGDTIALAATSVDHQETPRVYVFDRAPGSWALAAELPLEGTEIVIGLALRGPHLAVARRNAVEMFLRTEAGWVADGAIAIDGEAVASALCIEEGWLAVGAPDSSRGGSVLVFDLAQPSRPRIATLTPSNASGSGSFGEALACSPTKIAVGSPGQLTASTVFEAGAAFVFDVASWTETSSVTARDPMNDDGFGAALAFAGDHLVVGAPDRGIDNGSAFLFEGSTGTELRPFSSRQAERFGAAIAVSGRTILVAAPGYQGDSIGEGIVYLIDAPSPSE